MSYIRDDEALLHSCCFFLSFVLALLLVIAFLRACAWLFFERCYNDRYLLGDDPFSERVRDVMIYPSGEFTIHVHKEKDINQ